MALSQQKSNLIPVAGRIGYFLFAVPVGLIIVVAVWLAAATAYENVKFIHSTDQLLFIIDAARSEAAKNPDFGHGTGEDLIDDLVHKNDIPAAPVNGWNGGVRAGVPIPPFMRVETDVPIRACRRLAFYFTKDAGPLDLQRMEVREEKGNWVTLYDSGTHTPAFDYRTVNGACGDGLYATFALTVRLR